VAASDVYVDPALSRYAVQIAGATRDPESAGLPDLKPYVAFGASPRGPISLMTAARALALIRGRDYVLPQDVRELAKDALHHRIVLSYEALAAEIGRTRSSTRCWRSRPCRRSTSWSGQRTSAVLTRERPDRQARPLREPAALDLNRPAIDGLTASTDGGRRRRHGSQIREWEPGDDVRRIDWNATARSNQVQVRVDVAERALTSWVLLDVSPSMRFGGLTGGRRRMSRSRWDIRRVRKPDRRRDIRWNPPLTLRPRQGRHPARALLAVAASLRPSVSGGRRSALPWRRLPASRGSARSRSSSPTSTARRTGAAAAPARLGTPSLRSRSDPGAGAAECRPCLARRP
jgi:hypothetical protein